MSAIDAFKAFDQRKPRWIKVELEPESDRQEGEPPKSRFKTQAPHTVQRGR